MPAAGFAGQPVIEVERDGVHYTLLGTAHVSRASVDAVCQAIDSGQFDAVAVELDTQRHKALTQPNAMAELDLVKVIREKKVAPFAANLALAAYQRRLAEQLGIEPGAELKAAATEAAARGLPLQLIDRDVGITFRRILQRLRFWDRLKLVSSVITGLFERADVSEDDIERLKEGDLLESSFGEFARQTPSLYVTLIDERDQYMAAKLRQRNDGARRVLAVVGAGHLKGMAHYLANDTRAPEALLAELSEVTPKRRIPWITLTLTTLIAAGIVWGYLHGGLALGRALLLQWVGWTVGLTALGALLAGAHPFSLLAGAIAAPFKPFRPGLPSGMFSALVETHLRRPAYPDFLALRDDAQTLKGWYRNRVTRVLLVFMLTNLGTVAGEWLAGARILGKLLG
ncbi:MAG: TraB/GumN family protein [Thermomonas hydrothermalis]|uniref:Pheromone shutdown-related protein TraB n=2 Tax=Thermomonas hydrothermalis TaxID=213588 RepID=A0A1M4XD47_9GAMM|nr:TraB/GumN family protein [Thermomonas hydrothermalis]MCL6618925.1 TraB/GumN family protein [Thermomonas hydrothermalis]SHE91457.1 pheromone shutdown-related protein TraB [Thermomonas hydrothermalis]